MSASDLVQPLASTAINFAVSNEHVVEGFNYEPSTSAFFGRRIGGTAHAGKHKISFLGGKEKVSELELSALERPEKGAWSADFGYYVPVGDAACWYLQIGLPPEVFDRYIAARMQGRAKALHISVASLSLWVEKSDYMLSEPHWGNTWFMESSGHSAHATGIVQSISWTDDEKAFDK